MVVKHLKTIDFRLIYDTARACHKEDGIEDRKIFEPRLGNT